MTCVVIRVNGQSRQVVTDLATARLRINTAVLGAGLKETLWPDEMTCQVRESRQARATRIELLEMEEWQVDPMVRVCQYPLNPWRVAELQDIFMKPALTA